MANKILGTITVMLAAFLCVGAVLRLPTSGHPDRPIPIWLAVVVFGIGLAVASLGVILFNIGHRRER